MRSWIEIVMGTFFGLSVGGLIVLGLFWVGSAVERWLYNRKFGKRND